MARKRQSAPEGGHAARGSGKHGPAHNPMQAGKAGPEGTGNAPGTQGQEAPAAPSGASDRSPPGLDDARHAAAQRAAHGADVLHKGVFAALMASALSLDQFFETSAYRIYLEQVLEEAGSPTDPIERMLIEQTCLCHFRVAQLHVGAGQAKGVEAVKMYSAAASRLLGEMRRTALSLRAYRSRMPEGRPEKNIKLYKEAR